MNKIEFVTTGYTIYSEQNADSKETTTIREHMIYTTHVISVRKLKLQKASTCNSVLHIMQCLYKPNIPWKYIHDCSIMTGSDQ